MSASRMYELAEPLGLDETTIELVRILPLVYVAWADGEIQEEELTIILESAEQFGVTDDACLAVLQTWLGRRPDRVFFQKGLRLMTYLIATLGELGAKSTVADINDLCESVAKAAGGLAGQTLKVEPAERMAMRSVALELKLASSESTRKLLAEVVTR